MEIFDTIVLFDVFVEFLGDHLEPGNDIGVSWPDVIVEVSGTVSYHVTSDVDLDTVLSWVFVVLKDLPGKVWHVDSGVGFSSDVNFVVLELWVLLEERDDGSIVVL